MSTVARSTAGMRGTGTTGTTFREASPALSAEIFLVPVERNRYLVYAPLRGAAFIANAAAVNFIADLRDGCVDRAADPDGSLLALLRALGLVDAGPEPSPVTTLRGAPRPTQVTLFLTTACNLRCTYCYASAGDTPLEQMSLDVARRGIDYVSANARDLGAPAFEVAYHGGGEPTVAWRVLTASLEYARERAAALGLRLEAATATNGVLSDAQIDWIIDNMDGVSLSFDGVPEAHDRHRLTVAGRGSSARVMHTMRRFDEAGFPYGVRLTVTSDQIETLADSVELLSTRFSPRHIQVEPAYQLGRWRDAPSAETAAFIDAYREAERRAHGHGRSIFYSAARVGLLTNHFCGISQDSFTLSPSGNVSACYEVFSERSRHADLFFYGEPEPEGDGYRFRLPVLDNLRNQAVQHREFCRGCFAKWSCAGDCYHKAVAASGGATEFAGSDRCHVTRELTKDQILARIAASGGLFWHEPPSFAEASSKGKEALL